jgi:diguanylate cyclase (GGDEF)-like protein/PAS domain S-box-containing protein
MSHIVLNPDPPGEVRASHALPDAIVQPRMISPRRSVPRDGASRAAVRHALDVVPEAVYFLNAELRIVDVNAAAARVSGYRRGALRGMRLEELILDDGDGRLRAALQRSLLGESVSDVMPARQPSQDNISRPVLIQLHCLDQDVESRIVAVVHETADEADRPGQSALERDHLTSLPTRAALEARLRRAERRARQRGSQFAVLFIDVDGFKLVNDTSGHRAGDVVLRDVGQRLRACMRPGDFVARYGGDEFVVLVEDVGTDAEVERIAGRIRAELTSPIPALGSQFQLSASVGVAIGHAASSAQALIDEADLAMYRDKHAKRAKKCSSN